jgi:hypothetical protein
MTSPVSSGMSARTNFQIITVAAQMATPVSTAVPIPCSSNSMIVEPTPPTSATWSSAPLTSWKSSTSKYVQRDPFSSEVVLSRRSRTGLSWSANERSASKIR